MNTQTKSTTFQSNPIRIHKREKCSQSNT